MAFPASFSISLYIPGTHPSINTSQDDNTTKHPLQVDSMDDSLTLNEIKDEELASEGKENPSASSSHFQTGMERKD
jgi:hypothetical protein